MTRCKFVCETKTERTGKTFAIKLVPVTHGSKENEEFFKYTPFGSAEIGLLNSETAKQFEVGKEYYVDFTPVE